MKYFPVTGSPIITANPSTLSGFSYLEGAGPSTSQSYNLSGSSLTPPSGNIAVTGSTNYEVSLNNSTFSGSVNVTVFRWCFSCDTNLCKT